jgi:hypothetical protein
MLMYYVSTNRGATLVAAMSLKGARQKISYRGYRVKDARPATSTDVEYVRGMGGRIPEGAEILGGNNESR